MTDRSTALAMVSTWTRTAARPPNHLRAAVDAALDTLHPREREALRLRFGLDGNGGASYATIAKAFGRSVERVRQIVAKGLRKLRHPSRRRLITGVGRSYNYRTPRENCQMWQLSMRFSVWATQRAARFIDCTPWRRHVEWTARVVQRYGYTWPAVVTGPRGIQYQGHWP